MSANLDTAESELTEPDIDRAGLNAALSEATCLGLHVDKEDHTVRVALEVLTLPAVGPAPADRRVTLTLHGVSRIAASLRMQKWDDLEPRILPLDLDGLPAALDSFGHSALHGWEFLDLPDSAWAQWSALLSFDTELGSGPAPHVIELTQQEGIDPRELDVRVWFTSLSVAAAAGEPLSATDFIAGGVRWWAAHAAGDPRTQVGTVAPPL